MENKLILIAEDDKISLQYILEILREEKARILIANTGKEAVEQCRLHPEIDLVLMDVKMPEMGGKEATRVIKALRPDLPVIAQTAYAFNEDRVSILNAGFDDYIAKPLRKEDLIALIKKYI
ncbi:MAG: response regulator [FCB group bacterium]|nr:response regulator [FCB group bacterium]